VKAKHNDFEIPADNPFVNDKFNREPNAVALTNVIRIYQEGFTLAINGAWDTGKTTFIKMLVIFESY
jgi:ABC-type multidrug transport system ATPase subunit